MEFLFFYRLTIRKMEIMDMLQLQQGYTEKGIIVNDPYGNLNSGTTYPSHDISKGDGAFEEYDKKRWFIGDKWAGYLNK